MKPKLLKYEDFKADLLTGLKAAKKSITISVMAAYADPATEVYFQAILAAIERGVKVKIYLDNYTRTLRSENILDYIKYGIKNAKYLKNFQKIGAEVVWWGRVGLNPFAGRIHQKVYLVDDTAYVGGVNFTFGRPKNDMMVKIVDRRLVDRINNWLNRLKNGQKITNFYYQVDKTTTVIFNPPEISPIYDKLCELAQTAKKIQISSRMCPSGPVMEIFKNKSVRYYYNPIRYMTPPSRLAIWLDRRRYNVKNSYHGDKYIHAKCALIDDRIAIIGSENFNYRGVKWKTTEMGVVSSQKSLVVDVKKFFASL
jgi:phosphatidylserine/phosphatidylglycerophosphate/cardiolipin synthase-like enzyme